MRMYNPSDVYVALFTIQPSFSFPHHFELLYKSVRVGAFNPYLFGGSEGVKFAAIVTDLDECGLLLEGYECCDIQRAGCVELMYAVRKVVFRFAIFKLRAGVLTEIVL